VLHETVYRYEGAVRQSTHVFRLGPVYDEHQAVLSHALDVTPAGNQSPFEDLFGNRATHFTTSEPYSEMRIVSRSVVRLWSPPLLAAPTPAPLVLPLVWPPSEQRVLQPFLNAPELPRAELLQLAEFADGFAERSDYDLIGTLVEMAASISREFRYTPGVTTLQTTPYEVLRAQQGVCQDFSNLFISLARLLGVPARYRVGYIYTGGDYANKLQSEASHAWAECYLPWLGWRGFDPTNGGVVASDHVRVSCGRTFVDAAPTSGTLHEGGGTESLEVRVKVEELSSVEAAS
jgi:transglutaminase-like putative cysteine protease